MRYLTITRTLVYYDGPQLVLGQDGRGISYLGLGVPSAASGESTFLAVAVAESRLDEYFSESIDLRNIFRHPKLGRYFVFDLRSCSEGRYQLQEVALPIREDWLPESGFFASHHTDAIETDVNGLASQLDIRMDGRWDMADLAHFPNKYTDVYAFLYATVFEAPKSVGLDDVATTSRAALDEFFEEATAMEALFQRYPWKGGISTVGFYNDLYRAIPRADRLRIKEIQYASPGFIRLEANRLVTDVVQAMVVRAIEGWDDLRESYRQLYDGFSERGFLGVSKHEIEPDDQDIAFAEGACGRLCRGLSFPGLQRVLALCGGDWITTGKILLSFWRRVEDLAEFYDSGKASQA